MTAGATSIKLSTVQNFSLPYESSETNLDSLISAVQMGDSEPSGHRERVTILAILLADELGVTGEDRYILERGALLHDIGMIGVPDRVLFKKEPLSEMDWEEIKKHPRIGCRMCERVSFLVGTAKTVLSHHERWDGSGYPVGLSGEQIPLSGRVLSAVDALEAMYFGRPWQPPRSIVEIREEFLRCAETQFDPYIVNAVLSAQLDEWRNMLMRR